MVTVRFFPWLGRFACCALISVYFLPFLAGCAANTPRVSGVPAVQPGVERDAAYVMPFVTTLVPAKFAETTFNTFVDDLNDHLEGTGIQWFYIIKEDPQDVAPSWLLKQLYVTGEVWGYVEEAGCCSAELRVKARLRLHEEGVKDAVAELYFPMESFFEFDRTTFEAERERFAKRLADTMASQLLPLLTTPR
jgi:hypothetical protein